MRTSSRSEPQRRAAHAATIRLQFDDAEAAIAGSDCVRRDLSAAAIAERTLFVACDESASVERLVLENGAFAQHRHFNLSEFFELPAGADGEMDIEGLAVDGEYLWITGSHSLKRDKPDPHADDHDEAIRELTDIDREANRYFFGCVPLTAEADGVYALAKAVEQGDGKLHAACFQTKKKSSALMRALKNDVHFGPFLNVPSKENGFDIEGLAVRGERVFLGLRGPVLRGWAIVLELQVRPGKKGRLKPRRFGAEGQRYAKHFLDLDGLGVRDLSWDGDDLLILAGPTMDLDGPATVYRWLDALHAPDQSITPRRELRQVMQLPFGRGVDHPESMVVWRANKRPQLLVVYDSPAKARLQGGAGIAADVFALN